MLGGVVGMNGTQRAPRNLRNAARLLHLGGRRTWVAALLGAAVCAAACSRSGARPRDGALPWLAGTPSEGLVVQPPPTLVAPIVQRPPSTAIPARTVGTSTTPTPVPPISAGPSRPALPGVYPLITNLQPAPGAAVPPGNVIIGARVTGGSDLVDVAAFVNGTSIEPLFDGSPGRTFVLSFVLWFPIGMHEVRVEARNDQGQMGSYRWYFSVGPRQPLPTVAAPTMVPLATTVPLSNTDPWQTDPTRQSVDLTAGATPAPD